MLVKGQAVCLAGFIITALFAWAGTESQGGEPWWMMIVFAFFFGVMFIVGFFINEESEPKHPPTFEVWCRDGPLDDKIVNVRPGVKKIFTQGSDWFYVPISEFYHKPDGSKIVIWQGTRNQ